MKNSDRDWWRQAAIYQIYPRSFKDSNGDGIGDLQGIISEIDYLASLSLDAVWLSPFYPSALADGGYDVDDYRDVDPKIGTLEDFDEMIAKLSSVGIKVFVDIVPNHSSDQHIWFKEALASPEGSPARNRYIFRNGRGADGALPPSDWPSHFAPSAWTRTTNSDGTPGQWYLHLFAPEQPDFNWDNREVQEDFLKTLRFWADRGVAGFRVDVAHALKKDLSEPFRSYPKIGAFENPLTGDDVLFDRNDVHEIYREWNKVFQEYDPPRVAVAEAYVRVERRVLYARPDELGQAFNFDLLEAPYDAPTYKKLITTAIEFAKKENSSSTWVLENHDKPRSASRFGLPSDIDMMEWVTSDGALALQDEKLGSARANAAMMFLLALPGCTYIYQGEELGLFEVTDIPQDQIQDPMWKRNLFLHKGRDGCRVPLPWKSTGSSFGFGSDGSHLPQPSWFANHSVEVQSAPDGTLTLYRKALALRRAMQTTEDYQWVETGDTGVLHFARPNGWHCISNFDGAPFVIPEGEILLASGPLVDGKLGAATTIWIKA
jgi:alpha-glucosidase